MIVNHHLSLYKFCAKVHQFLQYINNKPRNKEVDYKDYDYIPKKYFMEHYRWCDHGKHYFDSKEEYQCICYAR
jgi:hypothetical protein